MKDPVRLLEDHEAPEAVRDLLRAARSPEPTEAQRSALWGAIAGAIGPGPGGGPEGGGGEPGGSIDPGGGLDLGASLGPAGGSVPAAVSSASSGAVAVGSSVASSVTTSAVGVKLVGAKIVGAKVVGSAAATWLGLAAAAGLSVGTAVMVGGPERPAPLAAPAAVVDQAGGARPGERAPREPAAASTSPAADGPGAPADRAAPIADDAAPIADDAAPVADAAPIDEAAARAAEPAPTAPGARTAAGALRGGSEPVDDAATSPAPASSTAREEVAVTTRARQLIHAGEPARALAELEAARVRFSGGVLVQERAALTVEALGRSGQRERAASLARAFLASWPNSAHAGLVRPWAD